MLSACDGLDSVDRSIKGQDFVHAGRFGLRDEVCLREVKSLHLVDLKRPQQSRGSTVWIVGNAIAERISSATRGRSTS